MANIVGEYIGTLIGILIAIVYTLYGYMFLMGITIPINWWEIILLAVLYTLVVAPIAYIAKKQQGM